MKKINPWTKFKLSWYWASTGEMQSMSVPYALLENTIRAISDHPSTFDITFEGREEYRGSYFSNRGIAVELSETAIVA